MYLTQSHKDTKNVKIFEVSLFRDFQPFFVTSCLRVITAFGSLRTVLTQTIAPSPKLLKTRYLTRSHKGTKRIFFLY